MNIFTYYTRHSSFFFLSSKDTLILDSKSFHVFEMFTQLLVFSLSNAKLMTRSVIEKLVSIKYSNSVTSQLDENYLIFTGRETLIFILLDLDRKRNL